MQTSPTMDHIPDSVTRHFDLDSTLVMDPPTIGSICDEFEYGFDAMQVRVHDTAQDKGWYDTPREIGTTLMLMVCELSEAMEVFRDDPSMQEPDAKLPEHTAMAVELADVVIRIMDFAEYNEIDVSAAVSAKAHYNESRPYRHGNKAA